LHSAKRARCNQDSKSDRHLSNANNNYSSVGHNPGRIALTLAPDSEIARYRLTGLSGEPTPVRSESGDLPANFYGPIGVFDAYNSSSNSNTYALIDGGEGHPSYYDASYVTHGDFYNSVYNYTSGDGAESFGSYIAGIVTPLDGIDGIDGIAALQAGKVEAVYQGWTVYPHSSHNHFPESPVVINVNFGTATWNGTWNNGVDGNTHPHGADSNGTVHLYGQVGFTAQGTISGANIQSTSVGTLDPGATIVKGQVQGSFFGPQAAAVGGVSDITKTNPAKGYENARNVDLFIANKVKVE